MATLPVYRTKTEDVTYLGRRARVVTDFHTKSRSANGLRTVTTTWIDDADERNGGYAAGTTTSTTVRGDGRTSDFERVTPLHVVAS